MNQQNKNGQQAMDFLLTYFEVILLALIVIVILTVILIYYLINLSMTQYNAECIGKSYCGDLGLDFKQIDNVYSSITCNLSVTPNITTIDYIFKVENVTALKEKYSDCEVV